MASSKNSFMKTILTLTSLYDDAKYPVKLNQQWFIGSGIKKGGGPNTPFLPVVLKSPLNTQNI